MACLKGWSFSVKLVYPLCRTTAGKLRPNWWLKQWNESHLKIWSLDPLTPIGLWVVLERQFFFQSQFSYQKDDSRPWSLSFLLQCLRIGVLDMRAFHGWPVWSSGPPDEGFTLSFPIRSGTPLSYSAGSGTRLHTTLSSNCSSHLNACLLWHVLESIFSMLHPSEYW